VVPQVEVWGFSKCVHRLGQAVLVAIESGHPDACVLPDVYHLYKGGSDFTGLNLLGTASMHVFHMNDYPANPPRQAIGDGDRVYPGDGVAPLTDIMQTLRSIDFNGYLSVELFNENYWRQDPLQVAQTALRKMQDLTQSTS
jgi:sugar phosphate isomerase/epimerase